MFREVAAVVVFCFTFAHGVVFKVATSSSMSCADVCGEYSGCSDRTSHFTCKQAAMEACGSTSLKRYTNDPQCNFGGCLANCAREIYAEYDSTSATMCHVAPACVYNDLWHRVCVCDNPTTSELTGFDIFQMVGVTFFMIVSLVIIGVFGYPYMGPLIEDAKNSWFNDKKHKQHIELSSDSTHSSHPLTASSSSLSSSTDSRPAPYRSTTRPSPFEASKSVATAPPPATSDLPSRAGRGRAGRRETASMDGSSRASQYSSLPPAPTSTSRDPVLPAAASPGSASAPKANPYNKYERAPAASGAAKKSDNPYQKFYDGDI